MPAYRAPVDDYRFLLTEVFDAADLATYPGYADATPDVLLAVLQEAGTFAEEVLFPLNQSGDAEGCMWANGVVRTPQGFPDAFRRYAEAGWISLAADPAFGGQGLPVALRVAVNEFALSSNLSFAMYPGLTQGVIETLHAHASSSLQQQYLPRLISGEFAGTMCLTEAHAGTDLGMIRTRAVPLDDGSYTISGTKIFITAGEHDLTTNIIHLVLARLPDAPEGSKGISLFLVPKVLLGADGGLTNRNAVQCGSIEHKMGIKGSATCVLNFDGARGWLVGEPHRGLRAMFTLMNAARLDVGMQGLGLAEVSYQNAVAYARERLQGRSLGGVQKPDAPADPIISHGDIRRGLLAMRAFVQGARALSVWTSMRIDQEHKHPEQSVREEASDLVALLTPVVKAFFTDMAFESTNIGLQTLGGHGYVREYGMEQYVRDARIGQIYEGTNHVQALDLVGRKLPEGGGRLAKRFAAIVSGEVATSLQIPEVADLAKVLGEAGTLLQQATMGLFQRAATQPAAMSAIASEYLRLFGFVAVGLMWLRMARISAAKRSGGGSFAAEFYTAKIATARFYFHRMMPQAAALARAVNEGGESVFAFPLAEF